MNTRHILFGTLGLLFLLTVLAACSPETAAPEPVAEVATEELVEATDEPTETAVPEATATDLPAPRVEETESETAVVEDVATEVAETETAEEVVEIAENEATESETEETEGDLAVAPDEPFYGRTAEGAFTIGYNSAPVKIIDYSDFL